MVISSCLPFQAKVIQPTVNTNEIAAAVVQTVQARYAELTASAPTITLSPTITLTATPTLTTTPTLTKTTTLTPSPKPGVVLASIPCNQAAFIEDVTVPDGTQISAGDQFTKTWQLQNTGSCTWTPSYTVIFDHGDLLDAPSSFNMPGFVNPGQTVDISVNMVAPDNEGTYEGFWRLQDAFGNVFGLGPGEADFDILIVVGNNLPNFEVRHVLMSVDNTSVTAACPPGFTFTITADIRTNGSGDVVYRWEFSNGNRSDDHTLHFDSDRQRTVSTTFKADETGTFWARIHTLQPDDTNFDKIDFGLTCTPALPTNTRKPTLTRTPTHTPLPTHTKAK